MIRFLLLLSEAEAVEAVEGEEEAAEEVSSFKTKRL